MGKSISKMYRYIEFCKVYYLIYINSLTSVGRDNTLDKNI